MSEEFTYEEITGNPKPIIEFEDAEKKILSGLKVLVTGAGGSIGSRVALQLSGVPGIDFFALDRDENALHSLSLSMSQTALFDNANYVLQDIRDAEGLMTLFEERKFDLVIHCAALKHLSALENYPREAYLTNVFGSYNLLKAATTFSVPGFLNVSTDKAVMPSSVLGKTKRIAELLTIGNRNSGFSGYTNVRFGNVFNSKGSVIETFAHQMKNNFPITLTDLNMRRFFMHIDEAALLAIKSVVINGGQIHMLDMGTSIPIIDVINNLKKFLGSSSALKITGARPGEKIDEDLMNEFENALTTQHAKIRVLSSDEEGRIDIPKIIPDSQASAVKIIEGLLDN
jgi:FlaA1/EpsC-like NDP-sugar epimerase